MQQLRGILMFAGGGLLFLAIWISSDVYNKYSERFCTNPEPVELTAEQEHVK